MRTVYLLRNHGSAGLDGEQLVARHQGDEIDRVSLPLIDQIMVMGNVQLSTPLLRACLQRGVSIVFVDRAGWCQGRLHPLEIGYRHRSRHQQQLGEGERLVASRRLISSKIANGRVLLLRLSRRQRSTELAAAIERLRWLGNQVERAHDQNRLRGLEGNAASEYFQALGELLRGDGFPFLGRHRRPPTTAFDALCGFGYSVLWNAMLTRVELQGLDPYEGVLHAGSARHAALVSDLIEPFRTLLVDPFNVWLIRTKRLRVDRDFEARDGGIFLADDGRRLWLKAWSHYMREVVTLKQEERGPRWELLDQTVRSFVRFLYDPSSGLVLPVRR
ncbi:MAG: CRISPR-associated endonuclease Cas1 [Cyanobacteriota bacterium]